MNLGSIRWRHEHNEQEMGRLSLHAHQFTFLFGVVATSEREPYPLRKWSLYIGPCRVSFQWRTEEDKA